MIRDIALVSGEMSASVWGTLRSTLHSIGGSAGFPAYIQGAIAIQATRRLMRYWADQRPSVPAEAMWLKDISRFVTGELFPGLEKDLVTRIARRVVAAEQASRRRVTRTIRTEVVSERKSHRCYLCGCTLDAAAPEGVPQFLTLEHLWPLSMGGESVRENLLPACPRCQTDKADAMSWEWFNVHNLVLPAVLSEGALKSVPWPARIARHYYAVMENCDRDRLSLKEGFIRAGAIAQGPLSTPRRRTVPVTFFDLQEDTS